jgi:hypothetical protein
MLIEITLSAAIALSQSAAPPSDAQVEPKREKRVCKRVMATNSLVRVGKVCRTSKDWQKESEAARRATEEMQASARANRTADAAQYP